MISSKSTPIRRFHAPQTRAWVALALASCATARVATAQAVRELSLREAVEQALHASPQVAVAAARHQAAAAGMRGAKAARLPQLDVAAAYQRISNTPELVLNVPGMPPRTLFPNIPDNTLARLSLQLPLYTGGRLRAQVSAAQQEASAAGSELEQARADLVLETSAAYWQLVAAREREWVAANAVSTYEAHVADARHRLELGLTARNEVLAVEVERDRAELARLQAGHDASVAQANLQRLLGLPPDVQLSPTEQLDRPVSEAAPLEQLVADALSRRPERGAAAARAQAAQARERAETAARWPQLAAAGGIDWANPNRGILPPQSQWDETWYVGVNLSLHLFDGGRIGSAVAQARAGAEAARQALRAVEEAVRLEVTEAALLLLTARQTVVVAQRAQASAEENRRVAADRYGEGVIPSSELLDAETALLNAGLDLTRARAQLQVAQAALERAVGGAS
jgi:outer membrane protein TolC